MTFRIKYFVFFISAFLVVMFLVQVPTINHEKVVDKGYVYKKQVVITHSQGQEFRSYQLGLQNPENAEDKGICIVDSHTYQLYALCSYYPYNLWEVN